MYADRGVRWGGYPGGGTGCGTGYGGGGTGTGYSGESSDTVDSVGGVLL